MSGELKGTKESCTCDSCVRACRFAPGWFAPGEVEKTAAYLGITVEELFKTKLMVNWNKNDVYLLSPAVTTAKTGDMAPYDWRGTCVFLKDGLCTIHDVKPKECRDAIHGMPTNMNEHHALGDLWKDHQDQVKNLLGTEPVQPPFEPIFFSWFGGPHGD